MRRLLAVVLLAGMLVPSASATVRTPILGDPETSVAQAQAWARSQGATETFVQLAELYWELAPARGIRPEIAYAQSAKETAFGRFGGVLDASFRNPCGLKKAAGGGNYDPNAHRRFPSWRAGVTAHLDHLALYAAAPGYPKAKTPDPRHFPFLHGKARTVQALGGNWAPSPTYGREIVRMALGMGTEPQTEEPAPELEPAPEAAESFWVRPSLAEGISR